MSDRSIIVKVEDYEAMKAELAEYKSGSLAALLRKRCEELQAELDGFGMSELTISSVDTYDKAMGELRKFWNAEARPWFCMKCGRGRLLPFGRYGYKCAVWSCRAEFEMVNK